MSPDDRFNCRKANKFSEKFAKCDPCLEDEGNLDFQFVYKANPIVSYFIIQWNIPVCTFFRLFFGDFS